jgi:hypothetical protein
LTTQMPAGSVPPIRREIVVDADPDTAFEVFTTGIGRWWPVADKSVHGPGSLVEFAGGQIVERSAGGETAIWGAVTTWNPPGELAFTWHPGRGPGRASLVRAGLTVLRLPGAGQAEKARKLATEDDQSVAGGLLAVTVRPWEVLLQA